MRLLNYTTLFFAVILLLIIPLWAALFYYNMLDEIYDSMDDGLDNQKQLIIQKAAVDSSVLRRADFDEGDYTIREVPFSEAGQAHDAYYDTTMYMQNEDEFEPVRILKTVFRQNDRFYELRVATSMVEEDDLVRQLLLSLVWLYLGLVVTILVLNNVLLRRIWKPFYRLLHRLKSFRLEKPEPVVAGPTRIAEFQLLGSTVQKMLHSNIAAYNSQKQFIENASHELQTPLAISLNKLESFIETNALSNQQVEALGVVMNNLERITRLNQSLLLLSRIENRQFAEEQEVDINALTQRILSEFSDQAAFQNITIRVTEEAPCRQRLHPDLAEVMIINLVKNALVHNHPSGFIDVRLQKDRLIIKNSGAAEPLDSSRLFDRFYKANPSASSTGLGLAIVKAIAELYRFTLAYSYDGAHIIHVTFQQS